MKKKIGRRSNCPINIALETMGDSWSLLIVRDLMFNGTASFNDFLAAGENIATNILSNRLQRLECAGIISKHRDPNDARRHIYLLTRKGIDLAPLLVEMILWASQYEETAAPKALIRAMRKDRAGFIAGLRNRWETDLKTGLPVSSKGKQKRPS